MTLAQRLRAKPHLIVKSEGVQIVEQLFAVPVAERDDAYPVRFVKCAPRKREAC